MAECEHLRQIIDLGESNHVCYDCGLVIDKFFEHYQAPLDSTDYDEWAELAKDILDRYHISTNYFSFIMEDFNRKNGKKCMEKLLFSTYKVLNSMNVNISLRDISLSTGISLSRIYSEQMPNETVRVDMTSMAERYCLSLNVDFHTISLIKELLAEPHESGHTPATVVAGTIYKVCKERKKNIPIKKISEVTGVSSISIQRFKNAFP